MLRKGLGVLLALTLLRWPPGAFPQATVADPEVAKGIRLVDDGDYDGAIVTLDAAVRRLAADPSHPADLPQAYVYLGIAFVGKGHEAAAKAQFREALKQVRDMSLSADKYPPKVIDAFEAAREELSREAAGPGATPAATPPKAAPTSETPKKGGGSHKGLLIAGGVVVAGGAAALALGGGGSGTGSQSPSVTGPTTTTFPNEVVVFGGGRDFVVDVKGTGTLTARVDWQQDGVLLGMYVVNLASPTVVLTSGGQTGSKQVSLSTAVTPGSYKVSVTNSTGMGPQVSTTFTLTVVHP